MTLKIHYLPHVSIDVETENWNDFVKLLSKEMVAHPEMPAAEAFKRVVVELMNTDSCNNWSALRDIMLVALMDAFNSDDTDVDDEALP